MLHHKILTSMLHFLWRERGASTMGLRAKNRWGGCSREDIEVLQYLFEKDGRRKRNLTTVLQESLWEVWELGCAEEQ